MIAIFSSREVKYTVLFPKEEFKVIRKMEDIRGIEFTGVILAPGWAQESSPEMIETFETLKFRHPELFKKFLQL